MRTLARHVTVKERRGVLYGLHGEIYGDVERSQQAVHRQDTKESARHGIARWGLWGA